MHESLNTIEIKSSLNSESYFFLNNILKEENPEAILVSLSKNLIDKYFKIWADDNQGDVKLSLDNDGTNNYNLSFVNGADVITLNEKFEPHKWTNIIDKNSPASATQVVNHTADAMFTEFKKV